MSFWKTLGSVFGTVGKDVEKVAIAAAPAAATAFGGPGAGSLVQAVIAEIEGMTKAGVSPNKTLLTTGIGQIIEGVIGVLQATGKLPNLDAVPSATLLPLNPTTQTPVPKLPLPVPTKIGQ